MGHQLHCLHSLLPTEVFTPLVPLCLCLSLTLSDPGVIHRAKDSAECVSYFVVVAEESCATIIDTIVKPPQPRTTATAAAARLIVEVKW